jgi:hypothetical protein
MLNGQYIIIPFIIIHDLNESDQWMIKHSRIMKHDISEHFFQQGEITRIISQESDIISLDGHLTQLQQKQEMYQ